MRGLCRGAEEGQVLLFAWIGRPHEPSLDLAPYLGQNPDIGPLFIGWDISFTS